MGLRKIGILNENNLIDFVQSQKCSIELSLLFKQPNTTFLAFIYFNHSVLRFHHEYTDICNKVFLNNNL